MVAKTTLLAAFTLPILAPCVTVVILLSINVSILFVIIFQKESYREF